MLAAVPNMAQAAKVSATLSSGLVVNAEYVSRDANQPAVVLLHGFLQTNEFLATRNMIDGLADFGYTVLGPSLSLGVGNRRKSLPCEALHQHTVAKDLEEIDYWVGWLLEKGHPSVVLVGHSWGGQHALAYVERYPSRPVTATVAVSLVRTRQNAENIGLQVGRATAALKSGAAGLDNYRLSFCNKFTATPESYLSYAQWTDSRVIETVTDSRVPVYVIVGGSDRRIDDAWLVSLRDAGAEVSVIDGADHFFSSMHEFEVLDELQGVLEKLGVPR
jgi:pimeloyl-ACP methyl ester carboxylesterase